MRRSRRIFAATQLRSERNSPRLLQRHRQLSQDRHVHATEPDQSEGWKLVALDLGLDPTTPAGELVATIMAAVAQWERHAIGVRTREALAMKRAQGVRLGRAAVLGADVVARLVSEHKAGAGWSEIASPAQCRGRANGPRGGEMAVRQRFGPSCSLRART